MRFCRFQTSAGSLHWGIPSADFSSAISLNFCAPDIRTWMENGAALPTPEILKSAKSHSLTGTKLLSVLPSASSFRDGYAFRQHVETARKNRGLEMIPEFDHFPVFYYSLSQNFLSPGELKVPKYAQIRLDYELEVALVLHKGGKNLSPLEAEECIFGLMVLNDWSAREEQMNEMKLNLGPAKGKDFASSLGTVLVTLDELEPVRTRTPNGSHFDLSMKAFLNGECISSGNLKDISWTFAQIVSRASQGVELQAGDVIGSGTVGTGCLLELNGSKVLQNRWLQHGDTLRLEVDRLGRLEHKIVFESA